jgi:hypothetical protein
MRRTSKTVLPDPSWFFPDGWRHEWTPYLLMAAVISGFLVGVWLTGFLSRFRLRWLGSKRGRLGRRAEKQAMRVLRRHGYRIEEHQPGFEHTLEVNGRPKSFIVTPDLVVSRENTYYVVEVKRLGKGAGISKAGVRRQVLEYLVASGLPCLLVSMPEGRIERVNIAPGQVE